jgi:type IV fimbrial biogenesis protein FimT
MRSAGRTRGIVLWEALLVIAVLAVLAAVAVPGFTEARRAAVLTAAVNQLVVGLHFARSTSILRGVPAVLCLSADGSRCVAGTDEPALGWLIFLDFQRSSPPQRDEEDEVLREVDLPVDVTLRATRQAVTYWPFTRSGTTSTFTFCNGSAHGHAVVVSQTGRPRAAATTNAGCER